MQYIREKGKPEWFTILANWNISRATPTHYREKRVVPRIVYQGFNYNLEQTSMSIKKCLWNVIQ